MDDTPTFELAILHSLDIDEEVGLPYMTHFLEFQFHHPLVYDLAGLAIAWGNLHLPPPLVGMLK